MIRSWARRILAQHFFFGPDSVWPNLVFDEPDQVWPNPAVWAGSGPDRRSFSGRDRPAFVSRAEIGPMSWRAEIGPPLFLKAEAGPSVWAGPAL